MIPYISLRLRALQSVMFFFIYIWYGIRIIRIYSEGLKLNMIMNQQLTLCDIRFQIHFILVIALFRTLMFRIILGYFRNFPAPWLIPESINRPVRC